MWQEKKMKKIFYSREHQNLLGSLKCVGVNPWLHNIPLLIKWDCIFIVIHFSCLYILHLDFISYSAAVSSHSALTRFEKFTSMAFEYYYSDVTFGQGSKQRLLTQAATTRFAFSLAGHVCCSKTCSFRTPEEEGLS